MTVLNQLQRRIGRGKITHLYWGSTRFYAVYINILPFSSPLLLSFVLSSCLSHSSCSSDTHCPSKSCLLLFFSGRTINANWRQLPHVKMTVSGLPYSGVLCHGREWKWCGKCDTSLEVGCCDHFLPPFLFLPMTQMRIWWPALEKPSWTLKQKLCV